MSATVYTAIFGGYDSVRPQPVPVHVISGDSSRPRLDAKWWKLHPEAVAEGVTIWIDGSLDVLSPTFPQTMENELGSDDLLLFRHPWRDCIYDEAVASRAGAKYDGQPLEDQAAAYRADGHPEHWGLMHGGCLVRRDTDAVRALDDAWWEEILRWTLQDQLSLPPVLRQSDARWHWAPGSMYDHLRFVGHLGPDVWR